MMAKKRTEPAAPMQASVSVERAARLYRLVELLGAGSRSRPLILKKLKIDIRTFYRDLELLRDNHIEVTLQRRKYFLSLAPKSAGSMLPFPDPGLTLGEAQLLAKGRTKVHKKMRELLEQIVK
jgi:hypothetical protein